MNRFKFITTNVIGVLGLSALSFLTDGCSAIYGQIAAYVGVGISAFQSVVNILAGAGIITLPEGTAIAAILALVKVGMSDVSAAVAAYEAAPAANKLTLAGKISTALSVVQGEVQQFWSDVVIPDAKMASTISGLLGLIISTIAGFVTALPALAVAAPKVVFNKTMPVAPKRISASQFRKEFNAILASGGYSEHAI
jgi:hypothetical protein